MPSSESGVLRETIGPGSSVEAQLTTHPQPGVKRPRREAPWAERVSQELDAVSATLCAAVGETRARLLALVQEEVHRGLERAIEDARAVLDVPATGASLESPMTVHTKQAADSGPPAANGRKDGVPLLRVVAEAAEREGGPSVAEAVEQSTPRANGVGTPTAVESIDGGAGDPAGELSNGTVRLVVEADGSVRRAVRFVDELCQRPQFRLLRLVGSRRKAGVEIWLGIREPVNVAKALSQMRGVTRVAVADDLDGKENEASFSVWLAQDSSAG